ncbi:MAG: hypothetical protein ACHQ0Y_07995 [Thermodesulfovibrionales bacterium]
MAWTLMVGQFSVPMYTFERFGRDLVLFVKGFAWFILDRRSQPKADEIAAGLCTAYNILRRGG